MSPSYHPERLSHMTPQIISSAKGHSAAASGPALGAEDGLRNVCHVAAGFPMGGSTSTFTWCCRNICCSQPVPQNRKTTWIELVYHMATRTESCCGNSPGVYQVVDGSHSSSRTSCDDFCNVKGVKNSASQNDGLGPPSCLSQKGWLVKKGFRSCTMKTSAI